MVRKYKSVFGKPLENLWKALDLRYYWLFMDNSVFIINGRFAVDIDKNEVLDRKTKASNRLEPRLMKLLCLFVKQMGQLVRREYIISEIWDDYPGANEGLNQAVSFLRKLLDDEQKTSFKRALNPGMFLMRK